MCYEVVGSELEKIYVNDCQSQRDFFCFHDYAYQLDVSKQAELMPDTKPLIEGLRESYEWYCKHEELVRKKPYLEYIKHNIEKISN